MCRASYSHAARCLIMAMAWAQVFPHGTGIPIPSAQDGETGETACVRRFQYVDFHCAITFPPFLPPSLPPSLSLLPLSLPSPLPSPPPPPLPSETPRHEQPTQSEGRGLSPAELPHLPPHADLEVRAQERQSHLRQTTGIPRRLQQLVRPWRRREGRGRRGRGRREEGGKEGGMKEKEDIMEQNPAISLTLSAVTLLTCLTGVQYLTPAFPGVQYLTPALHGCGLTSVLRPRVIKSLMRILYYSDTT